ncbi:MAG: hypothetical protein GOVbin630_96 [Prokaryotic dsDNA virus sp.]|nr:MAG: hypothetical protein GOVbin630_96 [Prokaryotic dsDNA virus sp.]|tara:strand:+ start:2370 stop:3131 length:762 start_codon:yes stop_codon:yes gene_type:complete
MKNLLVLYPHGLGDCILLTPALREFYERTGYKCHVAILERFKSSKIFDNCPYVENIFYTKDAWHDYPNSHVGFASLYADWKSFATTQQYKGIVMPMHSQPVSKIEINARSMGIRKLANPHTEIFTTEKDRKEAKKIIKVLVGDKKFGFVQTAAGHDVKSLPADYGRLWLKENKKLDKVIEIGKNLDPFSCNINVQFEILRQATGVCLPDSVFYHACHAMDKPVDFAYFARGVNVYNRVKPLHPVKENITYTLN